MSDRKSSRSRKQVDYSKFGGGEDIDDDDFADNTPPVAKKQKLSHKETKEKKKDKTGVKTERKARDRKSLEERLYEKELQAALEISLSQSEASQEAEPLPPLTDNSGSPAPSRDPVDAPAPVLEKIEDCVIIPNDVAPPSPIVPTAETVTVVAPRQHNDLHDEIQVLETDIDAVPSTSRRRSKPQKYIDSDSGDDDSDFAVDDGSESEDDSNDDYCEDDYDSDFDGRGKKRKRNSTSTPKPAPAKNKKENKKPSTTKTAKPATNKNIKSVSKPTTGARPKPSPICSTQKSSIAGVPARSSPLTAARKTSNWTPPGQAGSNNTVSKTVSNSHKTIGMKPGSAGLGVKSPSGGVSVKSSFTGGGLRSPTSGLRLGLSRNMKLKPLHPNLKIQN